MNYKITVLLISVFLVSCGGGSSSGGEGGNTIDDLIATKDLIEQFLNDDGATTTYVFDDDTYAVADESGVILSTGSSYSGGSSTSTEGPGEVSFTLDARTCADNLRANLFLDGSKIEGAVVSTPQGGEVKLEVFSGTIPFVVDGGGYRWSGNVDVFPGKVTDTKLDCTPGTGYMDSFPNTSDKQQTSTSGKTDLVYDR